MGKVAKREPFDHTETYEQVLKPLLEKAKKVCEAFDIPFIFVLQPERMADGDVIAGGVNVNNESAPPLQLAAHILGAKNAEDTESRIMQMAVRIAMRHERGEGIEELRDLFKQVTADEVKGDKPLN